MLEFDMNFTFLFIFTILHIIQKSLFFGDVEAFT